MVFTYAPGVDPSDINRLHPLLVVVLADFCFYCLRKYGFAPTFTSLIRPKTNDSGCHQTGRCADTSRHRYSQKGNVTGSIPEADIPKILSHFNITYPRGDGKDTVIYHDVGHGEHFHFQVALDKAFMTYENENIKLAESRRAV